MYARKNAAPKKYSCGYIKTPTIRNKISNYIDTVQSVIVDGEISFSSSSGTCDVKYPHFMMNSMTIS